MLFLAPAAAVELAIGGGLLLLLHLGVGCVGIAIHARLLDVETVQTRTIRGAVGGAHHMARERVLACLENEGL